MAVNNFTKEQCYSLLTAVHDQATGAAAITPTDLSTFITVANATLAAGFDNVLGAITQVVQRTIIAVRPYEEKFSGLQMSADTWGGIIRKISFADRAPDALEESYGLTDGLSVDHYVVKKPNVLETRYIGSDVYQAHYTITREQLKSAFANPDEFGSFMSGLLQHFANERTQWLEDLKRGILCNAIAAKEANNIDVIPLLTNYNTATGITPALTNQTVLQPANFKPFMEWCYKEVAKVSRLMTARSDKFQLAITGKPIYRHTPYRDQRVYFLADFLEAMDAQVLADTYHENFLRYADVEGVDFWQAIDNPDEIQVTPAYIDASGAVVDSTTTPASAAQTMTNVIGVIFDRDAMGYNIFNDTLETTPYNAAGQYYNIYAHMDVQLQNDLTEKIVVFTLN